MQRYCKEVIIYKRVEHPNVLPIEGVAPALFEYCMVSRWMENGNILNYVANYPGADRLELVRLMRQRSGFVLTRMHVVDRGHPRPRISTP